MLGGGTLDPNTERGQGVLGCARCRSKLGDELFDPRCECALDNPRSRRFDQNFDARRFNHQPDATELSTSLGSPSQKAKVQATGGSDPNGAIGHGGDKLWSLSIPRFAAIWHTCRGT